MKPTEEQFERVARWLDGEPVELSAAEREIADAIQRDERRMAAELDVSTPTAAMARARRRATAALAGRRRRWWPAVAATAAAAAIVLVAISLRGPTPPIDPPGGDAVPMEVVLADVGEVDLDLLAEEVETLAAEVRLSGIPGGSAGALDPSVEELWTEPASTGPEG